MLGSLSDNTIKQYSVSIKLWWEFCAEKNLHPYKQGKKNLILFLSEQFNKGCSYGSLNSHRSALTLLLGSETCSNDDVKRLLKGAYRLKPVTPKYTHTWDPQVILNYISRWYPNLELSLEQITKKLVILLALCTAHRVQTLTLIKLSNIHISETGIKILIPDIIKTSAPGREQPLLYLPYFRENPKICPASVIKDYMFITSSNRTDPHGSLLLTYKRPYRAPNSQTISRWIKAVLSASGVDVSVFTGHSTRHASTSAASAAGVSIDVIRKTAGWTSTSKTFARFYDRPLVENNEDEFARTVCSLAD